MDLGVAQEIFQLPWAPGRAPFAAFEGCGPSKTALVEEGRGALSPGTVEERFRALGGYIAHLKNIKSTSHAFAAA